MLLKISKDLFMNNKKKECFVFSSICSVCFLTAHFFTNFEKLVKRGMDPLCLQNCRRLYIIGISFMFLTGSEEINSSIDFFYSFFGSCVFLFDF